MNAHATELVRYDAMCRAIDAAYEVDEAKDIRDQAIALEVYARQAHNVEAERRACEIRLRAERKAGELSSKLEKAKPGRKPKEETEAELFSTMESNSRAATTPKSEALRNAGITPKQADQWEKLAEVPREEFEAALADHTTMPTTAGIIRASAEPKPNPVSPEALWLWGRLRDFERDGLLTKRPDDILSTMTPSMLDDVHTLAPRVATWLRQIGNLETPHGS